MRLAFYAGLVSWAAAGGGCSSGLLSGAEGVRADEFATRQATPAARPAPEQAPAPQAPAGAATVPIGQGLVLSAPGVESEGLGELVAQPGAPAAEAAASPELADPRFVDAKVGDINGKPVFAGSLLNDLEPRLTARARELAARSRSAQEARSAWRRDASQAIGEKLDGMLRDELLRAEALASLTPEQKQGLRYFLNNLQSDLLSQYRGSRALANQALLGTEGATLEEVVRRQEQSALIQFQLQQRIRKGVNISWRDIEREYERNTELFNPPPTARFRLVQVREGDGEGRSAVEAALASGTPFAEVAALPANRYKRAEGGLEVRQVEGEFGAGEFFAQADLNRAALGLTPGGVAGPIAVGQDLFWIHLEAVEEIRRPLYDMQLGIEDSLKNERTAERFAAYIGRLRERASFTELQSMLERLMTIAEGRYLEPALAEMPRPPLR